MVRIKKLIFLVLLTVFFFTLLTMPQRIFNLVKAITSWEQVDVNADGKIDSADMIAAIPFYGCPDYGDCPGHPGTPTPSPGTSPTPAPTTPPGQWSPCEDCTFSTQVISDASGLFIKSIAQIPQHQGFVFTGNFAAALDMDPGDEVFGFPQLSGWERGFIGGTLAQIENKPATAESYGLADDYEFLAYGPEFEHGAGEEAPFPETNVAEAESIAAAAGKKLMYAPSRQDYEVNIPSQRGLSPEYLIPIVAEYVDIWGIQLGFLQNEVDVGNMSEQEFQDWLTQWVGWIKSGPNQDIQILVQMGISRWNWQTDSCPPDPVEYVLEWRERMAHLIDGIIIMPGQPCQPCPPNSPPEFVCTNDEVLIAQYQQAFDNTIEAVHLVCD